MSQPVKLSNALVLDARLAGEILERSIAGQVELWARLGRVVESLLEGSQALALSRRASTVPLSARLDAVDSPEGRRRVAEVLEAAPYPHYEPAPGSEGLLVRIDADGNRVTGRFVHRHFQVSKRTPKRR